MSHARFAVLMLAATLGAFFLAPALRAVAQTAIATPSSFDGHWDVLLTCAIASDGAAGYTYQFPATITNGVFHGEHGTPGAAGWLIIDGTIDADGSSTLAAHGLTGAPRYSVGRVESLTAYSYHVAAHFGAKSGSGKRIEVRRCNFEVSRS